MKHFLILGTFVEPSPLNDEDLKKSILEHLDYLEKFFNSGMILMSGPYAKAAGGIILVKADSEEEVQAFIENDPLYIVKAQEYKVIEYRMHKCQDLLKDWF